MRQRTSIQRSVFLIVDYSFFILVALLCLLPMINVLAVSLSSSTAAASGRVGIWPVEPTFSSYRYVMSKVAFVMSLRTSLIRVAFGVTVQLSITVLTAYPLSKSENRLSFRSLYVWLFVVTMIFNGGLIPTYMLVRATGLLNNMGALVIPCAVNVFFILLLLNFFRSVPPSLEESALMDGAGHLTVLLKLFLPISAPAIATITLFVAVFHWNSWFDGMIYMNRPEKYPLSSYLQTVVIERDLTLVQNATEIRSMAKLSEATVKSAQIFLGALPILMVYPFLQRYFMKGIILGSIKE